MTGRHKRAIEDHFDNNPELEIALRAKGKNKQADMVKNILPTDVECFCTPTRATGPWSWVLCAERAVGMILLQYRLRMIFLPIRTTVSHQIL